MDEFMLFLIFFSLSLSVAQELLFISKAWFFPYERTIENFQILYYVFF